MCLLLFHNSIAMNQPDNAAPSTSREQFVATAKAALLRIAREIRTSAALTVQQTVRFARFARNLWHRRRLDQQSFAAQIALGRRLQEARIGDASLRSPLTQVEERIKSVQAAK